jgi:6-phosphogluconate dehydrogenase
MLRSRLFPAWLCWLGLAAGVVGGVDGVIVGPAFMAGGTFSQASQILQFAVLAAWLWMVATGVVLFRAAGRQPT